MGIFNKKKEQEPEIERKNQPSVEQKDYEMKFNRTREGRFQVDFYDKKAKSDQFYDTTRLVVDSKPLFIENQAVQNCAVSWYSQDDVVFLDSQYENESINARNYKGVLAQIDLTLLQTDPNYCSVVMRQLLNRNRVNKYLEDGLQETPSKPCGKYIGGVRKTENGYDKFFYLPIGKASHNSDLMKKRREEYRKGKEKRKQEEIDRKRDEMHKLQNEIDELSK